MISEQCPETCSKTRKEKKYDQRERERKKCLYFFCFECFFSIPTTPNPSIIVQSVSKKKGKEERKKKLWA